MPSESPWRLPWQRSSASAARVFFTFSLFSRHQTFTWLMAVYPLSWLVAAAGILFVLYYYRKLYMGPDRV